MIDIGPLWKRALRQAELDFEALGNREARDRIGRHLRADACPLSLDDLCVETSGLSDFAGDIARRAGSATGRH